MSNTKILVSYFSCSGITEKVARTIAEALDADLWEIEPKIQYSPADLDWNNPKSRSSIEMDDLSSRPQIKGINPLLPDYDSVFTGFPIWWYVAPRIINTFLENHDFSAKVIVPFATSGGSGMGRTEEELRQSTPPSASWRPGRVLSSGVSKKEALKWAEALGIG